MLCKLWDRPRRHDRYLGRNQHKEMRMADAVRMSLAEGHQSAKAALLAQGFSQSHANAIANTVTMAERDECRHHGLFRLPFYMNGLRSGQASPDAEPALTELAPSVIK